MSLITSPANPLIKRIRALRQRKARSESGTCFIEGIRLVAEAVALGAPVELLITAPELLTSAFAHETVAQAAAQGVRCVEVTAAVFESLSGKDGPQGLGAVVRQRWTPLEAIRPGGELCWVALDSPQDPGNVGTILRTCDAVGAAGVILVGESADPYDPGAVRASMGALFALRVCRAHPDELSAWKARSGFAFVGTSDSATVDYQSVHYQPPLIVLMGSERQGLSPALAALCDSMVSLPMVGRSDSLNLAVATGVMLYEVFSQRRRAESG